MENNLSNFGDLFINSVRDNTLFALEGIISGHMKSPVDKDMHEMINKLPPENIELLRTVGYRMVDLTLHNILLLFENNSDWKLSNEIKGVADLNELSDGLAGELYTDDGWIRQFSKYAPSKGL